MTTRTRKATTEKVPRVPKTPFEWDNLLRKAMVRAKEVGDRRHEGMRGVIEKGESAKILRKMGIICEADITREFPDSKT